MPFANPPAGETGLRAQGWADWLNPSGWLGVEPGSPQAGLQIASKAVPFVAGPAAQAAPVVRAMGPLGKAGVNAAANFLATGGDPVATAVGGVQGGLGGVVKKLFADPSKTTKFWSGLGDAIEQGRPNLAAGIQAIGRDPVKLAGYEGQDALRKAASAPFDAAMKRIEAKVGADTLIDLPMTMNQATELGLIRPEQLEKAMGAIIQAKVPASADPQAIIQGISQQQMPGVLAALKPTTTFSQLRDAIVRTRPRSPRVAHELETALENHLAQNAPGTLPVYQKAISDYRADHDIIREVVALQEMRALPGGSIREDTPRAITQAVDRLAPPRNPMAQGGEGILYHSLGTVTPRMAHLAGGLRQAKNILSRAHQMPPVQAPPSPQRVNLGQWLGAGASEIPAVINAYLPTEGRPRLMPGLGQE